MQRLLTGGIFAAGCWLIAEAAVTLLAQDTLARWASPVPRSHSGAPYLPGNPYLLWEMVPGERTELGAKVSVNQRGLRGAEIAAQAPQGVRRVVVVGDSSVYGHGVSDSETFASQLQDRLGDQFEVINAGVPGYSTEQSMNLLNLRVWDLSPDLLVIGSLWSDNNFDSFVDAELISEHRAFERRWPTPIARAAEASAVYRFLDWHLRISERESAVREVGWMLGRAPQGDRRRVPVNDYADNLQQMTDQAAERGAQVVFLGLANHVDLGAPTPGAKAWLLYREVMRDTATRNQAPLVNIPEVFAQTDQSADALFLDEMHPSAMGHSLIAQALSDTLQPWVDGAAISRASSEPVPNYEDPYVRSDLAAGPAQSAGAGTVEVQGRIESQTATPLQVDALVRNTTTQETVQVAGERLPGPGSFSMKLPLSQSVVFRVYRDLDGDGPGPGDPLISFMGRPVEVSEQTQTVVLDLDAETLSVQ